MSTTTIVDVGAALRCYRGETTFIRLFTLVRSILAPLDRVAAEAPPCGPILDVGCGHGLFANLLALGSSRRELIGIDPSGDKLAVARRSSAGLANIRYIQGRIEDVEPVTGGFRAVTILDVLYLLPDESKLAVLRRARELIAPDGVLLLKTNDTRPRWKYTVVCLEEALMVRVLGLTLGGDLYFSGVPQYTRLLQAARFEPHVLNLDGWRPVPHRLYVCRPVEEHRARAT